MVQNCPNVFSTLIYTDQETTGSSAILIPTNVSNFKLLRYSCLLKMLEGKGDDKTPHMVDMDSKVESPCEEPVITGDLISYNGVDPALAAKMHLVNDVRGCPFDSFEKDLTDFYARLSIKWALPIITSNYSS